jgi:hypothetical protein
MLFSDPQVLASSNSSSECRMYQIAVMCQIIRTHTGSLFFKTIIHNPTTFDWYIRETFQAMLFILYNHLWEFSWQSLLCLSCCEKLCFQSWGGECVVFKLLFDAITLKKTLKIECSDNITHEYRLSQNPNQTAAMRTLIKCLTKRSKASKHVYFIWNVWYLSLTSEQKRP